MPFVTSGVPAIHRWSEQLSTRRRFPSLGGYGVPAGGGHSRGGTMTSTSGRPTPDGDEDQPPDGGPSQPEGNPGVELGMSDGTGGTFEPEEDPPEDVET
jgi:hypothetical protein